MGRRNHLNGLVLGVCLLALTALLVACGANVPQQGGSSGNTPPPPVAPPLVEEEEKAEEQAPAPTIVYMEPQSEEVFLPEGFTYLDSSILLEIRYASTFNFIGTVIDGYERPRGIMTVEASAALTNASNLAMEQGYRLKVFDAYRPYRAHEHFVRWGQDLNDTLMQSYFYPGMDKASLFNGYIAFSGDPHSSGSTVDLTLVDMVTGVELDMGTHYDLLGPASQYYSNAISPDQMANRTILRNIMIESGFVPYDGEWWDFTLANEPYPYQYFDFPVR
jgi:D-alanyl-D-alanine dipeptidase